MEATRDGELRPAYEPVSRLQPGDRLGRYAIRSRIGAGGMGEVLLALDERLNRQVALKVIAGAGASDPDALRRFEDEARAASALSHPNVCVIHEVDERDGVTFIVMEHVRGESLRERLTRGALPVADAVGIAAQAAAGLHAAHEAGVVHRDVKPENLLLRPDGLVKVVDFGIAKLLAGAPAARDDAGRDAMRDATRAGALVGTIAYMSPEQARGLRVDGRSDVWSLGVTLFEMLCGRRPFAGESPVDTLAAILTDAPPPMASLGVVLPASLHAIVRRALEKDRERRYRTAAALQHDLHLVLRELEVASGEQALVTAAGVGRHEPSLLGTSGVTGGTWTTRTPARRRVIAVLPFESIGDAGSAAFTHGIADEVRGKLAALPELSVIGRASSAPYERSGKPPREIARELGAQYLLFGTVQWAPIGGGARARVSPELLEIDEGGEATIRWRQSFSAFVEDVFELQTEMAVQVTEAIGIALKASAQARFNASPTRNVEAYEAFLQSTSNMGSDAATLRQALAQAQQAVALDPAFAMAWAHIGILEAILYANVAPTRQGAESGRVAWERAIALAPDAPDGHMARGFWQLYVARDVAAGLESLRTAVQLSPSSTDALRRLATAERCAGHWATALAHYRQAVLLDPRTPSPYLGLSSTLLWLRRYPEAHAVAMEGLRLAPTRLDQIQMAAMSWIGRGDVAAARRVLRGVPATLDRSALVAFMARYFDLGWVLDDADRALLLALPASAFDDAGVAAMIRAQLAWLDGDEPATRTAASLARDALVTQLGDHPESYELRLQLALAHAYLGAREAACELAEQALADARAVGDHLAFPYTPHMIARVHLATGDHDGAIAELERLLAMPYFVSRAWLRVDPTFARLRGMPAFERLVECRD